MKAVITDHEFPDVENEIRILKEAGATVEIAQCKSPEEVIAVCADADALLVQWAPITREVVASLPRCKVIVRYGIGYDNIDAVAAADSGIAVCNIPDYASGEVADHAVSMAFALARQLTLVDHRLRSGVWNIVPDHPMPSFRDMRFVTLGYGRIARGVIERARPFGFQLAAFDPFVPEDIMRSADVLPLSLDDAFRSADILSLHLPLNADTKHIVNRHTLGTMKDTAIVVNTSRGGLIDTFALAESLTSGTLFASGLDVFETEPLEQNHPILQAPRAILTSHMAWHSTASSARLQRMTAEEAVRGMRGEPLRSQVNPMKPSLLKPCFDSITKQR